MGCLSAGFSRGVEAIRFICPGCVRLLIVCRRRRERKKHSRLPSKEITYTEVLYYDLEEAETKEESASASSIHACMDTRIHTYTYIRVHLQRVQGLEVTGVCTPGRSVRVCGAPTVVLTRHSCRPHLFLKMRKESKESADSSFNRHKRNPPSACEIFFFFLSVLSVWLFFSFSSSC